MTVRADIGHSITQDTGHSLQYTVTVRALEADIGHSITQDTVRRPSTHSDRAREADTGHSITHYTVHTVTVRASERTVQSSAQYTVHTVDSTVQSTPYTLHSTQWIGAERSD